jgi:outer membrane lipoprotein-sorting protein
MAALTPCATRPSPIAALKGCATAVFVLVALLVTPAAQAQTVDDVIAKNIAAKGGAALLKSTTSVRTTGKGSMQGAEVSITSSSKRPYFVRNEMEMAGQKIVQGFDGETLWMAMGTMPAQTLPPGPQTDVLKQSSQIDSPLLDYKDKGTTIELGEPAAENGRKQHHLIVKPKTGPTMHYFIDTETNLESRMVIDVEDGGQKMTMEMRFSDFKAVEGRTIPFTVTQIVNGNQVGQMKFDKVEFNVPLDDAMFRMPKQ